MSSEIARSSTAPAPPGFRRNAAGRLLRAPQGGQSARSEPAKRPLPCVTEHRHRTLQGNARDQAKRRPRLSASEPRPRSKGWWAEAPPPCRQCTPAPTAAICCNTPKYAAIRRNTLQYAAIRRNTLQSPRAVFYRGAFRHARGPPPPEQAQPAGTPRASDPQPKTPRCNTRSTAEGGRGARGRGSEGGRGRERGGGGERAGGGGGRC